MVKTVVNLKDYMPPLPEEIRPKGSLTLGIIVRQACCTLWNAKQQPFYSAAVSIDVSTSPSGAVWYDKATVVDQIIDAIQSAEIDQGMELPVAQVHARFTDWARSNNISRRQLKIQAKARMIEAAQAAE
jgi:hypothetical protein